MKYKIIIIANIAEAFEDAIRRVKSQKERNKRIRIEHNLCDRTLLWEGDNKVVVTPFPISPALFEKNLKALGFKNCINFFPGKVNIGLSDAIIKDKSLLSNIIKVVKDNPGIRISPYAVTPQFIKLVEFLREKKLKFIVEEMPCENSNWIIQFLDSKIGSRAEIDKIKSKNVCAPKSIICRNKIEAIAVAQWFHEKTISFVAKANFGEGGWGTLIFKKDDRGTWNKAIIRMKKELVADSIWDDGLIIIEECIVADRGISIGCPSSELYLSERGPQITYLCDQVVTEEGNFLGVALGRDALNKSVKDKINKASIIVGQKFWELGYRGFFDIDFVLSNENRVPYIIETNMRRTGGTHIFDVANSVFGSDWEEKAFILSRDYFCYGEKILSAKVILEKLKEILFPINNSKNGLIISIINKWQPSLGFIIIGKSSSEALEMYSRMNKLLNIKN
ncbi:MAG: hypothetical protein PHW12_01190 [Smithella sp.]|nr:hypothetical protein [Smithella sp.]MDD5527964.1 hypothetical protein [Patescibacteria group bacterium]